MGIIGDISQRPSNKLTTPGDEEGRFRPDFPRLGVGALVFRNDSFLLVKRGKPPRKGVWTPPGGLIRLGETITSALHRELYEECQVRARFGTDPEIFQFIEKNETCIDYHYVVLDYLGIYLDGQVCAGDDVEAAGWFTLNDLDGLDTTAETRELVHKGLAWQNRP